jgi:hypothetical protein
MLWDKYPDPGEPPEKADDVKPAGDSSAWVAKVDAYNGYVKRRRNWRLGQCLKVLVESDDVDVRLKAIQEAVALLIVEKLDPSSTLLGLLDTLFQL